MVKFNGRAMSCQCLIVVQMINGYLGFGLTTDEVAALRSTFRSTIDSFIRDNSEASTRIIGEDDLTYRQRMESLFLASLDDSSEFYMNLPSRERDWARQRFREDYDFTNLHDQDTQAEGFYHDYVWYEFIVNTV